MRLGEIFKDIYKGLRIEKDNSYDSMMCYLIDTKDVNKCIINYSSSELQNINMKVNDKYLLKKGDIIIATVPSSSTCHVGYCDSLEDDVKAIIKKNFIVLRNPVSDKYNIEFIAEYLENIGINDYISNRETMGPLTIFDIERILIPNISREEQDKLISVIRPINERCRLYNKLINNDSLIKQILLKSVVKNEK